MSLFENGAEEIVPERIVTPYNEEPHNLYFSLNIFFSVALQPFPGLGLLFRFCDLLYTYGRTPWMSDQLIARPLPTQANTNIE
jgi:hypothetical protein